MFLKRGLSIFRPYERDILLAIGDKLPVEAQKIFKEQLKKINLVQRLADDKEVNMYCMKFFRPYFDERLRFPLNVNEVPLAKVKIASEKNKIIYATVWLVKGRIFSISFSISPKILKNTYKIMDVIILENPMINIDTPVIKLEDLSLPIRFQKLLEKIKIQKIYAPLPEEVLNLKLNQLNYKFPEDWVELMRLCNGFESEKCKVYGFYHIRQITLEKTNLLVLVEGIKDKMLVIDCMRNDGHIYFINTAEDDIKFIDYGDLFSNALLKYLEQE